LTGRRRALAGPDPDIGIHHDHAAYLALRGHLLNTGGVLAARLGRSGRLLADSGTFGSASDRMVQRRFVRCCGKLTLLLIALRCRMRLAIGGRWRCVPLLGMMI